MKTIRVVELFAGVGGFRLGLERASKRRRKVRYRIVWSNQWEPSTKLQHASEIYVKNFGGEEHSNVDIAQVKTKDIPNHDLLVGGFPCQDYSVARTLNQAAGIVGKKGVLWWQIYRILNEKKRKPRYLFLENVDRLLKSPASQRGRDFAIMLASLSDLGYIVEWRVVNAADYGMPQRRRRVFILGYHKRSKIHKKIRTFTTPLDWVLREGVLARAFPVLPKEMLLLFPCGRKIEGNLAEISEEFNKEKFSKSPFVNSGIMINRAFWTTKCLPSYSDEYKSLGYILVPDEMVPEEFYIPQTDLSKWKYLKGAKNERRCNKSRGFSYEYNEGAIAFPDPLDKPSRTMITSEGGSTPSRFKHVINTNGRYRRLTPIELERLNMFPDDFTEGCSAVKRAFLMGNALVVGVVERIGRELLSELRTLDGGKHAYVSKASRKPRAS